MAAFQEIELKLKAAGANWAPTAAFFTDHPDYTILSQQTQEFEALYYDTNARDLAKESMTFRVRREGDRWIATSKGRGDETHGLHVRQEWNVEVQGPEPDLRCFAHLEIGSELVRLVGERPLEALFKTRFERSATLLQTPAGSVVELAIDRGQIIAGEKSVPIQEIEIELKSGHPQDVINLGAELAAVYPLRPEKKTKYSRGVELAGLKKLQTELAEKRENTQAPKPWELDPLSSLMVFFKALEDYFTHGERETDQRIIRQETQNILRWLGVAAELYESERAEITAALAYWRRIEETVEQLPQGPLYEGSYTAYLLKFWGWLISMRQMKAT
ncbi:MAG: CYTH domain-containing protein [Peptococcaceae bacterium]|nr:CYTH domain-containing protein [Peptococcaceae bacterium]